MNIEEALSLVQKCGGCVGDLTDLRGDEWQRLFILDSRGCQIGRLTFQYGTLRYVKSYKKDYHRSVDETDLIFMRLCKVIGTGVFVSESRFWELRTQAQREVKKDLREKRERREALPEKKRRRLQGKNPRTVLRLLVQEET